MKIVYAAQSLFKLSGVRKKVYAQCEGLEANGASVSLFTWSDIKEGEISSSDLPHISGKIEILPQRSEKSFFYECSCRLRATLRLLDFIRRVSPDVLYLRYPIGDPFWILFLLRCPVPVVVEHQTKELEECVLQGKTSAIYLCELFTGVLFRRLSSGIVAVTEEIRRYELARARTKDLPSVTIGNGFDVKSVSLRSVPLLEDEIRFLFVANVCSWHGVDRLIRGISKYRGNRRVVLHVVGEGEALSDLKKLVACLGLEKAVIFHGALYGNDLSMMFDRCHCAVGSLAGYRKGLFETSELKAREYASRGMPFFSMKDSDFDGFIWAKVLPQKEVSIDIADLVSFVERFYSNGNKSRDIRAYAKAHLDWRIKTQKLLDFMSKIV